MRHLTAIALSALIAAAATPAFAANEWGIEHERKARFEATVVDVVCEIAGDCAPQCGAGKRQLGLLTDDGTLVLAAKNFDIFAGTHVDLAPHCGKRILADGLMIDDPLATLFVLQFVKPLPDGEWSRANKFTKTWAAANPGKKGNQWFKHEPKVLNELEKNGILGLPGVEYIEE